MRIRELRAEARQALKGNLLKVALPLFFISILSYAFNIGIDYSVFAIREPIVELVVVLLLYVISILFLNILQFGAVIRTVKIARNEESHYFKDTFLKENVKLSFSVLWGLIKKYAVWIILMFLPVIITFASFAGEFQYIQQDPSQMTLSAPSNAGQLEIKSVVVPESLNSVSMTAITTGVIVWVASLISLIAIFMLIIVSYRYMLAYYLKQDYPDKSTKELLEKSRMMMRGNKAKAMVIPVTLIGWVLLIAVISMGISLILNLIWPPQAIYFTTISTVPIWATILANCLIYFLSSLIAAYLNMINYQLYMEQNPLEIYNDEYLKPETNAKKYICILVGIILGTLLIYFCFAYIYMQSFLADVYTL